MNTSPKTVVMVKHMNIQATKIATRALVECKPEKGHDVSC